MHANMHRHFVHTVLYLRVPVELEEGVGVAVAAAGSPGNASLCI